jgi:hypothetical protein
MRRFLPAKSLRLQTVQHRSHNASGMRERIARIPIAIARVFTIPGARPEPIGS